MSQVNEDEKELQALVGSDVHRCDIAGCVNYDVDERGPIIMRDNKKYKVCIDHFEAIYLVIGQQMIDAHSDDNLTTAQDDPFFDQEEEDDFDDGWPPTEFIEDGYIIAQVDIGGDE